MTVFQEELIAKVRRTSQNDARIQAVMMFGSFTQHCGDAFSDVEFFVFVNDEDFSAFNSGEWISGIHPFRLYFLNDYGTEVAIFDNLVRGEFHFRPQTEMPKIEKLKTVAHFPDIDSMCLCDKDGRLKHHLAVCADYNVNRYLKDNIQCTANNLVDMVLLGINVFKRGEIVRSSECLSEAQRFYLQLLRLSENKVYHWANPARCFEKEISPDAYRDYAACTADLQPQNILRAYRHLLNSTGNLLRTFGRQYGIDDCADLLQKIKDFL